MAVWQLFIHFCPGLITMQYFQQNITIGYTSFVRTDDLSNSQNFEKIHDYEIHKHSVDEKERQEVLNGHLIVICL